jgi:thioredoxin reductase
VSLPAGQIWAEVTALSPRSGGIVVTTTTGQTKARQVIAAVGEAPVRAPAEWQLPDAGPVSYWDHPGVPSAALTV